METNPELAASGEPQYSKEWSDDRCRSYSNLDHFPAQVLDSDVQKKVIERFFDFYLGGKVTKGLTVQGLVFSVISIMPLHMNTEDTIWYEEEYKDEGTLFSLLPEDIQHAKTKMSSQSSSDKIKSSKSENGEDEVATTDKISQTTNRQSKDNSSDDFLFHYDAIPKPIENKCNHYDVNEKVDRETDPDEIDKYFQRLQVNDNLEYKHIKNTKLEDDERSTINVISLKEYLRINNMLPTDTCCIGEENKLKISPHLKYHGFREVGPPPRWNFEYNDPTDNATFISSCQRLLGLWGTDEKARILLKFFFGILALTTMRGLTKSYKHLTNTFTGDKFNKYMKYINGFDVSFQYSTPNKKYIGACYRIFKKRERNTIIMFAKIIVRSIALDDQLPPLNQYGRNTTFPCNNYQFFAMNFLKSTLLVHTANYGLELVKMVLIILEKINTNSVNLAIELTYCEETAESWNRLIKHINDHFSADSKGETHQWARVIDENHFQDLSCANNYSLAVILAVFNERITLDRNIWLSKWVDEENKKEDLDRLKKLGQEMFEQFLSRDEYVLRAISNSMDAYYV